jgi:hypothetical protein
MLNQTMPHRSRAMPSWTRGGSQVTTVLATSVLALIASSIMATAGAAEAFDALKGNWSGGGSASFASGESEKLRCTARYAGGGSNLSLSLRCASSSAQINLTGNLDANGNRVSADWNESSFGLSGSGGGTTSGGTVRMKISGGINGYLTLNVSGNRHTVAISSQGSTLTGVNVSLGRR